MSTAGIVSDPTATLFPKSRRAILGLLYSRPDEQLYLRQIVDLSGLAVGQVQRELQLLSEAGILVRSEQGRHVFFQANERCPIYQELRGIVTKAMGTVPVLQEALGRLSGDITAAFVFGSVARGEETSDSDIDLMVIGEATFADVAATVRDAELALAREINVMVYPPQELVAKHRDGHHFIQQVLEGEKLFLLGAERELAALLGTAVDS